jgi:hypothetical protein
MIQMKMLMNEDTPGMQKKGKRSSETAGRSSGKG